MPNDIDSIRDSLETDGYIVVPDVIDSSMIAQLIEALDAARESKSASRRENVYAIRNLLEVVPAVRDLTISPAIRNLVEPILGPNCFAVRGILFDKTPDANWKVIWHQDLSIAVRKRVDTVGFGPWSVKGGVAHVQPPVSVLAKMLTVRLHLDHCDESNGPLLVIPRSHASGRLDSSQISLWRSGHLPVACVAAAGSVLIMRPLLLHSSTSALVAKHRRVIHIEFASDSLPGGLDWDVPNDV